MKNTSPREHSHQTDNPTSIQTLANSLRIPVNISDNDATEEEFKLLPRFRLTPLAQDAYGILELELMAKADKWHIPYNKDNPDFCDLEDDTCEYESLIKRTIGLDVNWDFSVYDPIGFEQAIEESEDRECSHEKELWNDYYSFSSRGV